jgi:hypothetical protein
MKIFLMLLSLTWSSFLLAADEPKPNANPTTTKSEAKQNAEQTDNPSAVIYQLFIAMAANDEQAIRKLILPNPDASVLWHGHKAPAMAIALIKKDIEKSKCRELKAGDVFILPGKQKLEIDDQMVNADNKMLVPTFGGQEAPLPVQLKRVKGEWKVDASSIIAGRLAAQKAMEKAESNK